jgi:uncharacterized protein YutE (UPF0331/DUF86 family)
VNLQVDKDRLAKLIGSLRNAQRLLLELATIEYGAFLKDEHKISSAKYNFIAAIEAAIDICNHLISRNKLRSPEDYADSFTVLCEAGIIDEDFASELVKMARFRNRLVHLYWDIDPKELHGILQTRLIDFDNFITSIGKHLPLN